MTFQSPSCRCNVCGTENVSLVYKHLDSPLGRYGLLSHEQQALDSCSFYPLEIVQCSKCSFAWNSKFYPENVDYSSLEILEAANYSKTYRAFQKSQALWISNRLPTVSSVIEIGGGDGYFLSNLNIDTKLLYEPSNENAESSSFQTLNEYFDPSCHHVSSELVVLRQVLEHIQNPSDFLLSLFTNAKQNSNHSLLYVYIEVPSYDTTLKYLRFPDFYYEHCNYFSLNSLAALSQNIGGNLLFLDSTYNDEINVLLISFDLSGSHLPDFYLSKSRLSERLDKAQKLGYKIAFWGASGNGISLLSSLGPQADYISFVIDSDSRKCDKYVPVTGHQVLHFSDPLVQEVQCIVITSQFHSLEIANQARSLISPNIEIITLFDFAENIL